MRRLTPRLLLLAGLAGCHQAPTPPDPGNYLTGMMVVRSKARLGAAGRAALSECPFPQEADKKGIDSAYVDLDVLVDESGKVTDVTVLNDPGQGFDEAARACTLKVVFEPVRDSHGQPDLGAARLRVHFDRSPPATP